VLLGFVYRQTAAYMTSMINVCSPTGCVTSLQIQRPLAAAIGSAHDSASAIYEQPAGGNAPLLSTTECRLVARRKMHEEQRSPRHDQ
jgi:hypothetical protein